MSEPTSQPFVWNAEARRRWTQTNVYRRRKNRMLWVFPLPYAFCTVMILIGLAGQGSGSASLMGGFALILLCLLPLTPLWMGYLFRGWWEARRAYLEERRAFWERYRVDPLTFTELPPEERERAPWE